MGGCAAGCWLAGGLSLFCSWRRVASGCGPCPCNTGSTPTAQPGLRNGYCIIIEVDESVDWPTAQRASGRQRSELQKYGCTKLSTPSQQWSRPVIGRHCYDRLTSRASNFTSAWEILAAIDRYVGTNCATFFFAFFPFSCFVKTLLLMLTRQQRRPVTLVLISTIVGTVET
jgi:hypothetical protein